MRYMRYPRAESAQLISLISFRTEILDLYVISLLKIILFS